MSIRLLQAIFLSGVYTAVDGATLSLDKALEADLVQQGKAEFVAAPFVKTYLVEHAEAHASLGLKRAALPPYKTIGLLTGQASEAYTVVSCTYSADTTNFHVGDRGAKMTMSGAVTGQLRLDYSGGLYFGPAQAIGCAIYLPDPTKVTAVEIDVYQDAGLTIQWARSKTTGFVTGWNYFRLLASAGTTTNWGYCYRLRVMVTTNAATTATVGLVWAEVADRANLIFINDGPYDLWMRDRYPDLKSLSFPVVLGVDAGKLSFGSGLSRTASENQVIAFANDGNANEISFHGYTGDTTQSMTADELLADTVRAQSWLRRNGFLLGSLWRAAYVQNLATNAASTVPLLMAQATSTDTSTTDAWPPINANNVPRISLHGRSAAYIDSLFGTLQTTRGLAVVYMHNVDAGGGANMTPQEWTYFVEKVRASLAAGWLRGATFETLFTDVGGTISVEGGRQVARMPLLDGTTKAVVIG